MRWCLAFTVLVVHATTALADAGRSDSALPDRPLAVVAFEPGGSVPPVFT